MRIYFSKLIGSHYSVEQKMFVLDWMLKTGIPFSKYIGKWIKVGVNKTLYDYSANDHFHKHSIPVNPWEYSWWFDAIFSRAIYKDVYEPIQNWRESENIFPNKFRVLKMIESVPKKYSDKYKYLPCLINSIFDLRGNLLDKNYHHKEYKERTKPKITWIQIFTIGGGWRVQYGFSFEELDYEDGWEKNYSQKQNQSLWEFFGETIDDIKNKCLTTKSNLN